MVEMGASPVFLLMANPNIAAVCCSSYLWHHGLALLPSALFPLF
jgi:hypothetical protein